MTRERRIKTKIAALALGGLIAAGALSAPVSVMAGGSPEGTTYVSFGADLSDSQRSEVMQLLEITPEELAEAAVIEITNQEEYDNLGKYLSEEIIGHKAMSSVKVTAMGKGYGIQVRTKNINYCTPDMYRNALATAGVEDADVIAAGPFNISGTAALIGATKAYSEMTGTPLKAEKIDAAANELVATSIVGENIGDQQKASDLIAAIKAEVIEKKETDPEEIDKIIDDTAMKLEISLSEDDRTLIRELMEKLGGLNLDFDSIKEQVSGIYENLQKQGLNFNISEEQAMNFFQRIIEWLRQLFSKWFH